MTRFARAQGSKASNQREPEEATPWHVMKQKLEEKKNENPEANLEFSYKQYLQDNSEEPPIQWVAFSDEEGGTETSENFKKHKNKTKKKQKKLKNVEENNKEFENNERVECVPLKKSLSKNKKQSVQQKIEEPKTVELETIENSSAKEKNRNKKRKNQDINREIQENLKLKKTEKDTTREKSVSKTGIQNNELQTNPKTGSEKKKNKLKNTDINKKFGNKRKFKEGKEKSARKPRLEYCEIGGKNVALIYIDGFPVKKEDGERLIQLRKDLISRGVPRSEIEKAMKLERRRAEKALAREKKKLCFNCRGSGHVLSECPNISMDVTETTATGICFKCGSTEHTHFECKVVKNDSYKFAQCFICKEQGHISRQCPDNPKGLYPQGGGCNVCGDVTHLKKDCPAYVAKQEENKIAADTIDDSNIDSIGLSVDVQNTKKVKKQKVVKF